MSWGRRLDVFVLGRRKKGKRDFTLVSDDQFGFDLECIKDGVVTTHYNINTIIWGYAGENVYLSPNLTSSPFDFSYHDKIKITKATRLFVASRREVALSSLTEGTDFTLGTVRFKLIRWSEAYPELGECEMLNQDKKVYISKQAFVIVD